MNEVFVLASNLNENDMKTPLLIALTSCTIAFPGWGLEFDQTITDISGSGNPTGWTTGTDGDIVLGLRARNTGDNSTVNADGVYTFAPGDSWNLEFSINLAGTLGENTFQFYLGLDSDDSLDVDYRSASLIMPLDLGNNIFSFSPTIVQNSLSLLNGDGTYDYRLFGVNTVNSPIPSFGGNNPINPPFILGPDVNIRVIVSEPTSGSGGDSGGTSVPDAGSTLALICLSLAGLAGFNFRKRS